MNGSGIAKSLQAKGFPLSRRINPEKRGDIKVTPGFQATDAGADEVRVVHVLGSGHRIARAADRVAEIESRLSEYAQALNGLGKFSAKVYGGGESQWIVVRECNPVVSDTLRNAAYKLYTKLGTADNEAASLLLSWADSYDSGEDW